MTAPPPAAGPRRRRLDAPLAALDRIAQVILDGRDADDVFDSIAREALAVVDAMGVTLGTPTGDGTGIVLRATAGGLAARLAQAGIVRGSILPIESTFGGHAILEARMIVSDEAARKRTGAEATWRHALEYARRTGVVGPIMAVPLAVRGRALGGLAVARAQGSPPFSAADIQIVRTFAAQATVALELSQVRDELRQLAVVQERERIAREMHDGVIQSLFGLGMNLQGLATSTTLPPPVSERLNLAVDAIDATIRDLRNYIFGLRPGLLANRELEDALRRIVVEVSADSDLHVDVAIDPVAAVLLSERGADVVQVAREALSNVRRHAYASTARVVLYRAGKRVILEVVDNGRGLGGASERGMGLDNMHARAIALGGELLLGPGPDQHG